MPQPRLIKALMLSFTLAVAGGVATDADAAKKKPVRAPVAPVQKQERLTPDGQAPRAERYASIVIDFNSKTELYGRDADQLLYSASTTKIMTAYLVFEAIKNNTLKMDTMLDVSANALRQPNTNMSLRSGKQVSVEDLLTGLLIHSANNASVVLGEAVSGSESAFVAKMNATAKAKGWASMHYVNPNGLPNPADRPNEGGIPDKSNVTDPNNKSTVRDMAYLVQAVLKEYPQHAHFFRTPTWKYNGVPYRNTNKLLGVYPGLDFGKTGTINASRLNLAVSAKQGDYRIIAVNFGAQNSPQRTNDMTQLLNFGFEKLQNSNATFKLRNTPTSAKKIADIPDNKDAEIEQLPKTPVVIPALIAPPTATSAHVLPKPVDVMRDVSAGMLTPKANATLENPPLHQPPAPLPEVPQNPALPVTPTPSGLTIRLKINP